jgi:hypothetical protein
LGFKFIPILVRNSLEAEGQIGPKNKCLSEQVFKCGFVFVTELYTGKQTVKLNLITKIRQITILLTLVAATSISALAQDEAFPESAAFDSTLAGDTAAHTAAVLPLLPSRLGPMESVMWSEHGLMRKVFDMPLTTEERAKEFKARRTMLQLHQLGGYATLAALAATVVLGQLTYNGNESMAGVHGAVASTAIAMYFTTAGLALFTPPPAIRRGEWSTVSTHKLLATVHFSGMMLTPILGSMIEGNRNVRTVHLASGYITTAAFAGAMLAVTF